jgi:hypothetical protein
MPQFAPGTSAPFPGPSEFRLEADTKRQRRMNNRKNYIDKKFNRVAAGSVTDAQRGRPIADADMKMLGTALKRRKEKRRLRGR